MILRRASYISWPWSHKFRKHFNNAKRSLMIGCRRLNSAHAALRLQTRAPDRLFRMHAGRSCLLCAVSGSARTCARGIFPATRPDFRQMQGTDTTFPVIECTLRYKAPARYDDVLTTEVWLALVERARLNFNYRIRNQEKRLILEAETLHVCAVLNGKPKRISEELLAMLRPYLQEIGR